MLYNCAASAGDRCYHISLEHVICPNICLSNIVKDSIVIVVYSFLERILKQKNEFTC